MAYRGEGESLEPYLNRKTLFVKDIEPGLTKHEIKTELLQLCPPTAGKICVPVDHHSAAPLNYAYCNFNRREDAEEAFRQWRFSLKIGNKPVRVTYAVEKKENLDRVCGPWGRKFFIVVKNVAPEMGTPALCQHFEEFGEIFFCKVDDDVYGQTYGVIQYIHEKSVRLAVERAHNTKIEGFNNVIQVEMFKNTNSLPLSSTTRYSVHNLPPDFTTHPLSVAVPPQLSTAMSGSLAPGQLPNGTPMNGAMNGVANGMNFTGQSAFAMQAGFPDFLEFAAADPQSSDQFRVSDTYLSYNPSADALTNFSNGSSFPSNLQRENSFSASTQASIDMYTSSNGPSVSEAAFTPMQVVNFGDEQRQHSFPGPVPGRLEDVQMKSVGAPGAGQNGAANGLGNGIGNGAASGVNGLVNGLAGAGSGEAPRKPVMKLSVALRAAQQQMDRVSELFCCPITQAKFKDPVIAGDGHTYERKAIDAWLETNSTSPLTNEELPHKWLVPNKLVLTLVSELAS